MMFLCIVHCLAMYQDNDYSVLDVSETFKCSQLTHMQITYKQLIINDHQPLEAEEWVNDWREMSKSHVNDCRTAFNLT